MGRMGGCWERAEEQEEEKRERERWGESGREFHRLAQDMPAGLSTSSYKVAYEAYIGSTGRKLRQEAE